MNRQGSAIQLRFALVLGVIGVASLVAGSGAIGATTAPTFARADYSLFGDNYLHVHPERHRDRDRERAVTLPRPK